MNFFFGWPTLVTLHNVHAWTLGMSTRGRRQGPCAWTIKICFTNVHFSRSPHMDHFEVHSWTSLSSRVWELKTDLFDPRPRVAVFSPPPLRGYFDQSCAGTIIILVAVLLAVARDAAICILSRASRIFCCQRGTRKVLRAATSKCAKM
jgi:hypothetical protein